MHSTRLNDTQLTTLVSLLQKKGLCTSDDPKKAIPEATEGRLICHKTRTSKILQKLYGSWIVESNSMGPLEKDIPVLCLIHKVSYKTNGNDRGYIRAYVKSNDEKLQMIFNITNSGKATLEEVSPYDEDEVVKDILKQPLEVLLQFLGINPMLDAYIHYRLANKEPSA